MRICIIGDVHWSQYSSILRSRGLKYSHRLEKLIESVNWAEALAESHNCDATIYLGDFFDQSQLNSEELTALQDIEWNSNSKMFLVGNHEMGLSTLDYSSAHLFKMGTRCTVFDTPCSYMIDDNTEFCFLPYIVNADKTKLSDHISFNPSASKRIIFSHNDIAGIQMGKFISKSGFDIRDIESECDLFINGHLHNGCAVTDKIYNVGNLTGQNFSEDASRWEHCVFILDTDTLHFDIYENPYAINFYKLDFTAKEYIDNMDRIIGSLKPNAVCTVRCSNYLVPTLKERLEPLWRTPENTDSSIPRYKNILESRIIVDIEPSHVTEQSEPSITTGVNHLQQFEEFVLNTLGNSDIVKAELEMLVR